MIRSTVFGRSCCQCQQLRPAISVSTASLYRNLKQSSDRNKILDTSRIVSSVVPIIGLHKLRTAITLRKVSSQYMIRNDLHNLPAAVKRRRSQYNHGIFSVQRDASYAASLLPNLRTSSTQTVMYISTLPRRNVNVRWNSSSRNNNDGKSEGAAATSSESTTPTASTNDSSQSTISMKSETTSSTEKSSPTFSDHVASKSGTDTASAMDSSVHNHHPSTGNSGGGGGKAVSDAVVAATHELEQRIIRVVRGEQKLTIGDQLSVALIAIFTTILLAAPYAVRHMKQRANTEYGYEDRLPTEDPVDEFVKLARREWKSTFNGNMDDDETNTGNEENNQKFIEVILKDVLQSKTVQHAAQEFVVQIIQSERFQSTIQHLVKELWNDLITDPETVAQVIKLLEIAITSTPIKNAVIELILQITVRETEFRNAMIQMIQSLGMNDDVRNAVVQLLTEATHTTLNDPDILDHSMEFATDVVGDDIVQQTAGEALRKSVEHAVKPATTIILSAFGVGLLTFSFIALGYSRSSDTEARVFVTAARSLQSNAAIGMSRILHWPFRTLPNMIIRIYKAIGNRLSTPLHQVTQSINDVIYSAIMTVISFSWKGIQTTAYWLSSKGSLFLHSFSSFLYKHAAATTSSLGVWIGSTAIAIVSMLESGVLALSIMTWKYTVHGTQYVGSTCYTITLRASTYIGDCIMKAIATINQYFKSYNEW